MKKMLVVTCLMTMLCAVPVSNAYDIIMYDDIGVAYGLTESSIEVENHKIFLVDAYVYILPGCPLASNGYFCFSASYGSMKLIIFESQYFYDFCMEGRYNGAAAIPFCWCNANGKQGSTYVHIGVPGP